MKRIMAIVFLISIILIVGCSKNVEDANEDFPIDEEVDVAIAFEEYKQQTDKIINDMKKNMMEQEGRINVLTARIEKLESEIWKIDDDYVEYYNEEYEFGFYLPSDLMENAIIKTEENKEGTNVSFYYSGYKHECGLMQKFFSVFITSPEQEVTCCGGSVCTPYMIQNDKAYYITTPIDSILPPEKSDHYRELSINEDELIARRMKDKTE